MTRQRPAGQAVSWCAHHRCEQPGSEDVSGRCDEQRPAAEPDSGGGGLSSLRVGSGQHRTFRYFGRIDVDAVLIGETLMRSPKKREALEELNGGMIL